MKITVVTCFFTEGDMQVYAAQNRTKLSTLYLFPLYFIMTLNYHSINNECKHKLP